MKNKVRRLRRTIARVFRINTLNIGVGGEEVHENSLDRLGLVNDGLGSNIEAANGVGINVVLLQETVNDY